MKKNYTTFIFTFLAITSLTFGQSDTLLFEDFQDTIQNILSFPDPDSVGTNNWVNWDEDALDDANNRPTEWYYDLDVVYIADDTTLQPMDTNIVFSSSSWLAGYAPGNRNFLITPPIEVVDDQAMLFWESSTRQGPSFMDGYSVAVSTTDTDEGAFEDTLFRVAQHVSFDGADPLNPDDFTFFPADAYVHADRYTLADFFTLNDGDDSYIGLLEPHSVSLADYVGETIYILFLHDSDDDNYMSVDNILVTGSLVTSNEEVTEQQVHFQTFPNPVKNTLIVNYRLEEKSEVQLSIYNMEGKLVRNVLNDTNQPGNYTENINLRDLSSGTYFARLMVNGELITKKIIKQ